MSSNPDNVYLDLVVVNNDNTGGQAKTSLSFTETRNSPFLDNPDNYYLAVARFEVDTGGFSLPLFSPVLLLDGSNNDINKTIYTITMTDITGGKLDDAVTKYVMWAPEDKSAALPNDVLVNGRLVKQDFSTGYYNCYSTEWWINCINKTLLDCWNTLIALRGMPPPASCAPFFTIDPLTNLVHLFTPTTYTPPASLPITINFSTFASKSSGLDNTLPSNIGQTKPPFVGLGAGTPKYSLFFNEPLMNLFSSLPFIYYGNDSDLNLDMVPGSTALIAYDTNTPYLNYYVQPINYNGLNTTSVTDGAGNVIQFVDTVSIYSPVPMWNPVTKLVFTSSFLPVSSGLTSVPNATNSNDFDFTFSSNQNANVINMLTDLEVDLVSGNEYKPQVLYIPESEYRLIDMFGVNPLSQASFSVSWRNPYGEIIPFQLGSQMKASIKFVFRRKRYNLNNLEPYNIN